MKMWLFHFTCLKLCSLVQNVVENSDYHIQSHINIITDMGLNYQDICHFTLYLCKTRMPGQIPQA